MDARYIQRGESLDVVPERDIAAGEIMITGSLAGIARLPIRCGELGSLALSGVFDVVKPARCAFSTGSLVFWDAARRSAVTAGGIPLGLAAQRAGLDDGKVRVILNSGGVTVNSSESILRWQTVN